MRKIAGQLWLGLFSWICTLIYDGERNKNFGVCFHAPLKLCWLLIGPKFDNRNNLQCLFLKLFSSLLFWCELNEIMCFWVGSRGSWMRQEFHSCMKNTEVFEGNVRTTRSALIRWTLFWYQGCFSSDMVPNPLSQRRDSCQGLDFPTWKWSSSAGSVRKTTPCCFAVDLTLSIAFTLPCTLTSTLLRFTYPSLPRLRSFTSHRLHHNLTTTAQSLCIPWVSSAPGNFMNHPLVTTKTSSSPTHQHQGLHSVVG